MKLNALKIHWVELTQAELTQGRVDSMADLTSGRVDPLPIQDLYTNTYTFLKTAIHELGGYEKSNLHTCNNIKAKIPPPTHFLPASS